MPNILNKILEQIVFWMAWIIIPLIMEIIPALGGFVILLKKKLFGKKEEKPIKLPEITLIIPVYNSADTLEACLASVHDSTYPTEQINILLVNNQSKDDSFKVYCHCQELYPDLKMQWLSAKQGKSKALNMALFCSDGKYIIHIDSDGVLEKNALENMVIRFEDNPDVHCMTGAVLTSKEMIEDTESFWGRIVRRCEFLEYCQAFLAGRNFQSELDSIYTLSGAFSAFRKSVILKTQLYNTDTVCEDTHVTFQIRKLMKKSVHLCENALFFVDPIESGEKLYTQRQRWQTGELEVSHMFLKDKLRSRGFFSDFMIRVLTIDHTFAFPRMIWYFALLVLGCMNYSFHNVAVACVLIYLLYVCSSFLYYLNILSFLREFGAIRRYYAGKLLYILILPLFNLFAFFVRFAGIINSIRRKSSWKTLNFTEEKRIVLDTVKKDFTGLRCLRNGLLFVLEKQETKHGKNV